MTSSNNPYRGSTSSGATLVKYDSLGRNVQVTHQDGSTVSWDYSGNSVIITDELSRKTKQVSDALGRLTDVYEANLDASTTTVCSGGTCRQIFNPGYHTHYTYDALNNLTKVEQYGGAATPQVTRSFLYDSLSRLISSTNPETSGAITYSYTSSGGGFCASDPSLICSKTDARNITTTYSYDDLDRLVSKTYSDGTPYSCYAYDTSSLAYPSANMLGRLAHEWTQVGGCDLSSTSTIMTRRSVRKYDPLGRAKVEQRCVLSNCTTSTTSTPFSLHMEYDLAGNVTEYDNGFQSLNITNSFDSAGRLVKVTSGAYGPGHPNTLYKVNSFLPSGVPNTWDLGLNLSVTQNQDSRLRPKDLTVTEK
ncbi:MAG: hypothetical protein JF563_03075 [Acidobacteriales bacterium]|nr:hypothetical protein [Terriglobales bacterium]